MNRGRSCASDRVHDILLLLIPIYIHLYTIYALSCGVPVRLSFSVFLKSALTAITNYGISPKPPTSIKSPFLRLINHVFHNHLIPRLRTSIQHDHRGEKSIIGLVIPTRSSIPARLSRPVRASFDGIIRYSLRGSIGTLAHGEAP